MASGANDKDEDPAYRREFESDLFYLGTFGLKDDLRPEIHTPISQIKYGHTETELDTNIQVNVRMISGDHLETCKQVAIQAGIIKPDESQKENCVLTGSKFREAIGTYHKYFDQDTNQWSISFEDS